MIAILGAIMNVIRGGIAAKYLGKWGKPAHHVVFGLAVYLTGYTWYQAALAVPVIYGVFSLGWGRYVSPAIDHYVMDEKENTFIDWVCRPLEKSWLLFSLASLTLRGCIIGIPLGILLQNYHIAIAGALMGVVYVGVSQLAHLIRKPQYAWPLSEAIFGSFLWVSMKIKRNKK